jgi:hypothetical protein
MNPLIVAISSEASSPEISRHAYHLARCAANRSEVLRITVVIEKWKTSALWKSLNIYDSKIATVSSNISNDAFTRNQWHLHHLASLAHKSATDLIHVVFHAPIRRSTLYVALYGRLTEASRRIMEPRGRN